MIIDVENGAMTDINQLYQDKILSLARSARTHKASADMSYSATVKNPTCGDSATITVNLDDEGCIIDIGVHVQGCALCEAGAGLLIEASAGKTRGDLAAMASQLATWLAGDHHTLSMPGQEVFTPVRDFTARHTCVCLPFHAIIKALPED